MFLEHGPFVEGEFQRRKFVQYGRFEGLFTRPWKDQMCSVPVTGQPACAAHRLAPAECFHLTFAFKQFDTIMPVYIQSMNIFLIIFVRVRFF